MLVYDKEGTLIEVISGERTRVSLPKKVPEGAILIHHHPSGTGPSGQDIRMVLSHPGATFRLIRVNEHGKLELVIMKAKKRLTEEKIKAIGDNHDNIAKSRGNRYKNNRDALDSTLADHGSNIFIQTRIFQ